MDKGGGNKMGKYERMQRKRDRRSFNNAIDQKIDDLKQLRKQGGKTIRRTYKGKEDADIEAIISSTRSIDFTDITYLLNGADTPEISLMTYSEEDEIENPALAQAEQDLELGIQTRRYLERQAAVKKNAVVNYEKRLKKAKDEGDDTAKKRTWKAKQRALQELEGIQRTMDMVEENNQVIEGYVAVGKVGPAIPMNDLLGQVAKNISKYTGTIYDTGVRELDDVMRSLYEEQDVQREARERINSGEDFLSADDEELYEAEMQAMEAKDKRVVRVKKKTEELTDLLHEAARTTPDGQ